MGIQRSCVFMNTIAVPIAQQLNLFRSLASFRILPNLGCASPQRPPLTPLSILAMEYDRKITIAASYTTIFVSRGTPLVLTCNLISAIFQSFQSSA